MQEFIYTTIIYLAIVSGCFFASWLIVGDFRVAYNMIALVALYSAIDFRINR